MGPRGARDSWPFQCVEPILTTNDVVTHYTLLAANTIVQALADATHPLIITSYLGRNPRAVPVLVSLSDRLAVPVYASCPASVEFPMNHPHFVGLSYGYGPNTWLREADVILVIDSDIPWIPVHNRPPKDARIFHLDVDVLKPTMGMFHIDAEVRATVDGELALQALLHACEPLSLRPELVEARRSRITAGHKTWLSALERLETAAPSSTITLPYLFSRLREGVPAKTLFLNEAVSNYNSAWAHLRPTRPGSAYTSGAAALGWGLGAAIGSSLGKAAVPGSNDNEFIALVVGDGTFVFCVPSAAYWIARKYETVSITCHTRRVF